MSMRMTIVSMQQEMYQDAVYFFRNAETSVGASGDPFMILRDLRAGILFSFAAVESCINQFIDEHVERNMKIMSQIQIDYWTEKRGYVSIEDKLKKGVELYGGTRLSHNHKLWKDFQKFKELRNGLVHFKVKNRVYYQTIELLERTRESIRTAGSIIKEIYLQHPNNVSYPKVFDKIP